MKKITTLAIALAFGTTGFSQVTLQASDLNPTVGESFTVSGANWVSEGSAGSNVTWDLSAMQSNGTLTVSFAAGSSSFPGTNFTQTTSAGAQSSIAYIDANSTGQFYHGIEAGPTVITYQDPMKMMAFPLSSSVNETDNFAATFSSGGFDFTRSGTSNILADGWGTLTTPEGTFTDVIRVKHELNYTDSYSAGTITYQTITYSWYKAGGHYALASVSEVNTSAQPGTQYSGQYLTNVGNLNTGEVQNDVVSMFPNPTSSNVNIELHSNSDVSQIGVFDYSGKRINSVNVETNSVQLNLENAEPGIYFLHFYDNEKQVVSSQKVIKR